jgi:malate/lactate dehydrogenase
VVIGEKGVERIVEISLNAAEKKKLQHSVDAVRTLIKECERLEKADTKKSAGGKRAKAK